MILRIDRHAAELPPPSDPDPKGAACVQELLGGKYGEMSTLMNYTFQSFNFRNRQGARPFYDLVANNRTPNHVILWGEIGATGFEPATARPPAGKQWV